MTDRAILLALADRLEALGEPCFDAEDQIEKAAREPWRFPPPNYTASIDAAITLIPDISFYQFGHDVEGPDPSLFRAKIGVPDGTRDHVSFYAATARTLPLAITAAAIRARAVEVS